METNFLLFNFVLEVILFCLVSCFFLFFFKKDRFISTIVFKKDSFSFLFIKRGIIFSDSCFLFAIRPFPPIKDLIEAREIERIRSGRSLKQPKQPKDPNKPRDPIDVVLDRWSRVFGLKILSFFEIVNPAFSGTPRWLVIIRIITIFVVLVGISIEIFMCMYF